MSHPRCPHARPDLRTLCALLEQCVDPRTGFLPARTPIGRLPGPFAVVSDACEALAARYHGPDRDVRPWLDAQFRGLAYDAEDLDGLDEHVQLCLMTQTSLLCHAYRWRSAPARPDSYQIDRVELPAGLDRLWSELADRLGTPRVGLFYTMVCNNFRLAGRDEGAAYDPSELTEDRFELMHSWLTGPERDELRAFILAAIGIEGRGATLARALRRIYLGIERDDVAEVSMGLAALADAIGSLAAHFNQQIRRRKIRPASFLTVVQPTMIWLLDHGEGPLEGASGPQSCVVQLLDNALGVPRRSRFARSLVGSRRYMLPRHRRLVDAFDGAQGIIVDYVRAKADAGLTAVYDRCLQGLLRWRTSHRQRGAMFLRGDEATKVDHYASTGLVVGLDVDRVATFEAAMDEHMAETSAQMLGRRGPAPRAASRCPFSAHRAA